MLERVLIAWLMGGMVLLTGCAGQFQFANQNRGSLQVTGSSANVRAGETVTFSASNTAGPVLVRWSVNGLPGGNLLVGTIDDSGKFQAPASLPADNLVQVTATDVKDAAVSGSSMLTLLNPIPVIASVTTLIQGESLQLQISGRNFVQGAKVNFGGTVYAGTVTSSTQIQATIPGAAAPAGAVELVVTNPDPGAASSGATVFSLNRSNRPSRSSSSNGAARFLEQASFGPTATEVSNINALRTSLGTMQQALSQYIDTQMDTSLTPASTWPDIPNPIPINPVNSNPLCGQPMNCVQLLWFQNALLQPDQLRQRTAFAMSQIWVVSGNTVQLTDSFLPYYRILNNRAFDNYLTIMNEVTLSSAMGYYLDMGNSPKPVPGSIANENYARELLQLFTIGLYMLNDDGTFQLDGNGQRLPAYTEADVQEFARALTGWTYQRNNGTINFGQVFTQNGTTGTNRTLPMIPVESQHDTDPKTLINYPGAVSASLPASQSAQADLNGVLQNIFNHPNVPPFICQQLIQHLVTSNPSPAYVGRMSAVFKNNGAGVRGDLKAVMKAILLDPEARQSDFYPVGFSDGHLKEPVLYMTGILRSLGFSTAGQITYTSPGGNMSNVGQVLWARSRDMGENVLFSPSVFNYFAPDYSILQGTFLGPEFQLQTTANAPVRVNFADDVVRNRFTGSGIDINASLGNLAAIATSPAQLVDQLEQTFMRGQMSSAMKQAIIDTISVLPSTTTTDRTYRAKIALYLTISSSQYQVAR